MPRGAGPGTPKSISPIFRPRTLNAASYISSCVIRTRFDILYRILGDFLLRGRIYHRRENDHSCIVLCCYKAVNIANSHPATIEEPRHAINHRFQPHPGDMDLVTCASARLKSECFAEQQYQPSKQYCPVHPGYHCAHDANPTEH